MRFENTEVFNFSGAFRGMRNPKESHHLSDSEFGISKHDELPNRKYPDNPVQVLSEYGEYYTFASIGEKDMELAQTLIKAGSEHRKFMRQILVSVDITAPLFWWKEFDTYKVGTVANSTSTMHRMASKPITIDCFEIDDYNPQKMLVDPQRLGIRTDLFINDLEQLRQIHLMYKKDAKKEGISTEEKKRLEKEAKQYWKELIRWLPESWLQTRTVTMTYENLFAMCSRGQRRFHKLNEWSGVDEPYLSNFIGWVRTLPYAQQLIFIDEDVR